MSIICSSFNLSSASLMAGKNTFPGRRPVLPVGRLPRQCALHLPILFRGAVSALPYGYYSKEPRSRKLCRSRLIFCFLSGSPLSTAERRKNACFSGFAAFLQQHDILQKKHEIMQGRIPAARLSLNQQEKEPPAYGADHGARSILPRFRCRYWPDRTQCRHCFHPARVRNTQYYYKTQERTRGNFV